MNIFSNSFVDIFTLIQIFLIILIVFLLLRELVLWYWKINENTKNLKRIANSLEMLVKFQKYLIKSGEKKNSRIKEENKEEYEDEEEEGSSENEEGIEDEFVDNKYEQGGVKESE